MNSTEIARSSYIMTTVWIKLTKLFDDCCLEVTADSNVKTWIEQWTLNDVTITPYNKPHDKIQYNYMEFNQPPVINI